MVFKLTQLFFIASLKYVLTVPYFLLFGIEYKYALPTMVIGGIVGFIFFYFLSRKVMILFRKYLPRTCNIMPEWCKSRYGSICVSLFQPKRKILFSRRTRFIVKMKRSYGLWGIVITTPVLLSIPVGAFIASRYYAKNRKVILYMLISIVGWGAIFSSVLFLFPGIFA